MRRSADRQVGTKEWSRAVEQRNEVLTASGHLRGLVIGIVGRLRRAEGIEQTITDATQGPRVAVAALAQRVVTSPCGCIVLNGCARPVTDGILQPFVTGMAADHEPLLAAAPDQRTVPARARNGAVISRPRKLCGLGEPCGENDPANSWPRAKEDRNITLLTVLPRRALLRRFELGTEPVQRAVRLLDLLIDQARSRREAADMRRRLQSCPVRRTAVSFARSAAQSRHRGGGP